MAGNNPASQFPKAPPRFFDRGNGAKLLQPTNQVASIATIITTATTGDVATIGARVNSIIAALQTAGIMQTTPA